AVFTVKHRSKSIPSKDNKFKIQAQKKLGLFRTTFYQVLCNHNPDIIASDNDFIEYLAEQVWDLDILSLILVDNSESESAKSDKEIKPLSEKEVVEKIYDVVKDDFLTFEVCQNEQEVVKKGLFTKEECLTRGTNICRPCHSACHKMISHEKMAYEYNTVDKLLEHEGVIKFVTWVSKQKEYSKDHAIRKLRYSK
ncbi:4915_t:CDS:2, partial [Cetraspora pellucida]